MNTTQTERLMALADAYAKAYYFDVGGDKSVLKREALLAALQAREGEAVANSAILARGRFHAFKGEDGEPDDWEWFEEGTNCEHGCIDAVIVRADAITAPQPAQPSEPAQPVALPLTVDVCFIDGDDPFICTVHGKITVDALSEIEADIHENPDFGKGDGVYSYNVTRFNGQYGFEGRCELPPDGS